MVACIGKNTIMTRVVWFGFLLFVCLGGVAQAAGSGENERQVLRFC